MKVIFLAFEISRNFVLTCSDENLETLLDGLDGADLSEKSFFVIAEFVQTTLE